MHSEEQTGSRSLNQLSTAARLKSIFMGSVGNLIEWYDWYAYAAFSIYFANAFFPDGDLTAQLLRTSAIFAVGFFMRPIGGWLMGSYADRKGRKNALILSVLLMCLGSFIIAVTPSYHSIGIAAPILLTFARLIQGISVGGEYATSAAYLCEMATKNRRGFYSSFQYVTLIAGQLLALTVLIVLQQYFLTEQELESFGWRIPFFIGGIMAIVALYLRCKMHETAIFEEHKNKASSQKNLLKALLQHPRSILTVVGLTMGGTLAFYTYSTYMQKYLTNTVGMSKNDATLISAATLFIFMLIQPVIGALSDKIGRRPILLTFGILGTLCTVPILTLLTHTQTSLGAFLLIMTALCIVSGYTAINAVVKAELFPVEIRALGIGLPYALTVSIFGGTAEYVALWFKSIQMESGFYWYVTACIACSLVVYLFMKDTQQYSVMNQEDSDVAAQPETTRNHKSSEHFAQNLQHAP